MNLKFKNALKGIAQKTPPVWFMRQAGRYHKHYQKLKEKHDFMQLCKTPELAALVAMGPIEDFDFDVAILFSDLLFPLEALGMGLKYEPGPILDRQLTHENLSQVKSIDEALEQLQFQKKAMQITREMLPHDKSLIGFVGGPWTLFAYAVGGSHDGHLLAAKSDFELFHKFSEVMLPLLTKNIQLQLDGGAEVVMIFDTAAGELSPRLYNAHVADGLNQLAQKFKGRLGYYSKSTQPAHLNEKIFAESSWAGFGVDHRWDINQVLKTRRSGFVQGNFDQALLFSSTTNFRTRFDEWLKPIRDLSLEDRAGWVCGLGHGVLPKTPEHHVREFVERIRKEFGS